MAAKSLPDDDATLTRYKEAFRLCYGKMPRVLKMKGFIFHLVEKGLLPSDLKSCIQAEKTNAEQVQCLLDDIEGGVEAGYPQRFDALIQAVKEYATRENLQDLKQLSNDIQKTIRGTAPKPVVDPHESSLKRNILVVGRICSGKTSLINNVIGEDCLHIEKAWPNPSTIRTAQHVSREFLINNTKYHCTFIELPCAIYAQYRLYNKSPLKEWIMQTTNPCQREYLKRLNLIIYVMKQGRFTREDMETFVYTHIFPQSISALVVTNCELCDNAKRTEIVEKFKSQVTKDVAASMGKGIYTVGFPDLTDLDDMYGDVTTLLKLKMQEDVSKLHQLIAKSGDSMDINVSSPVCSII